MDNLRYIRETIERAGSFTAVPGIGGMLMGSTALAAAWIASHQPAGFRWLSVWLIEAVVAAVIEGKIKTSGPIVGIISGGNVDLP